MSEPTEVVLMGKKLVDSLFLRAQAQINKGDIHENQGFELEKNLDKWLDAYDTKLNYQEKCRIREYFYKKMKTLNSARKE